MSRTTPGAVRGVGKIKVSITDHALLPFIECASNIVETNLAPYENASGTPTITTAALELVERWLSVWFYRQDKDLVRTGERTGPVTAQYEGSIDAALKAAKMFDSTGILATLLEPQKRVSMTFLGRDNRPSRRSSEVL